MINYFDLQNKKNFSYDGQNYLPTIDKNKKTPTVARLLYSDVLSHSMQMKKNISKEELLINVELKMHEDLGLDIEKSYKILHIEKKSNLNDLVLVEGFSVDRDHLEKKYKEILKDVKYIDYLAIPVFIYETLYTNKILTKKNDIFFYIGEFESFVTFYKDGKYISSKKMLSIDEIRYELSKNDILVSNEELITILSQKGFDKSRYDNNSYHILSQLEEIFSKMFLKIDSISTHNRSLYGFIEVDRVFVGINSLTIPEIKLVASNFTKEALFSSLNFSKTDEYDVLDILSISYANDRLSQNDNSLNMTIYARKKPFFSKEIGKLSLSIAASVLLAGGYIVFEEYSLDKQRVQLSSLENRYENLSQKTKKLQLDVQKVEANLKNYQKEEQEINSKFILLREVADELLAMKSTDKRYTHVFLTINKYLKKYKLTINKIKQVSDEKIDLELISKDEKRGSLAKFMRDLLDSGFEAVVSNEISLDNDRYKSVVTVSR